MKMWKQQILLQTTSQLLSSEVIGNTNKWCPCCWMRSGYISVPHPSGLLEISSTFGLAEAAYCMTCHIAQSVVFIAPHISLSSLSRVREQMQSQDSFILQWGMEIWRAARLMYLTQWKPQAEHMKTSFREASSHPDLLPPCWQEFSTRSTAETLQTAAFILPPQMLRLGMVWCLSAEPLSHPRRLHGQLWAKISSVGLCLIKWGQWLCKPRGGRHKKVFTLMFSDLFRSFSYKGKQNCAMNALYIVADGIFSKIEMFLNTYGKKMVVKESSQLEVIAFHVIIKITERFHCKCQWIERVNIEDYSHEFQRIYKLPFCLRSIILKLAACGFWQHVKLILSSPCTLSCLTQPIWVYSC